MALYAYEEGEIVDARQAHPQGLYWCLECQKPVKVRKSRTPHFYHLKLSPSCRLYSKSEDHLLLQLQIQSLFPEGESVIERIFSPIKRISDVVWEKKKIAFEIQCSMIYPKEAKRRVQEYKSLGYEVIWILDDRHFNKKKMRPSEMYLRNHHGYYVSFHRHGNSFFYDQFEVFSERRRIEKSGKFFVNLRSPAAVPQVEASEEWPLQILERCRKTSLYLPGDLFHTALSADVDVSIEELLYYWKMREKVAVSRRFLWWDKFLIPLKERLDFMLAKR